MTQKGSALMPMVNTGETVITTNDKKLVWNEREVAKNSVFVWLS